MLMHELGTFAPTRFLLWNSKEEKAAFKLRFTSFPRKQRGNGDGAVIAAAFRACHRRCRSRPPLVLLLLCQRVLNLGLRIRSAHLKWWQRRHISSRREFFASNNLLPLVQTAENLLEKHPARN